MHLPSAAKLWQTPGRHVLPIAPLTPERLEPLEVHATSYFAESVRMLSLSIKSISSSQHKRYIIIMMFIIEQIFVFVKHLFYNKSIGDFYRFKKTFCVLYTIHY